MAELAARSERARKPARPYTTRPDRVAPAVLVFALLTLTAFADGGLLPRTWRLASIGLLSVTSGLLLRRRPAVPRRYALVLVSLAALDGWTLLSSVWSMHPGVAVLQSERVLVYLAALTALGLAAQRSTLPQLTAATLAAVTIVSTYALLRYLVAPPPIDRFEGRLLHQPYGYANALGIVAAIGIVLAITLARIMPTPIRRASSLAPLVVLAPTLALTSSRGADTALAAALAVLVGFGSRARAIAVALVVVLAGAVAAGVIGLTAYHPALARLVGPDRPRYWRVAVRDFGAHHILGSGAGSYGDYLLHHGTVAAFSRTAHSLYLQSLAELGPLGLALVLTALALPLVRLRNSNDPLTAGLAGAYVAYFVHTGIDWDWELPAVTLLGLFCGAMLILATDPPRRHLAARTRALLLGLAILLAALETYRLAAGPTTPFGPT